MEIHMEDKKIKIGDSVLTYKKGFKWQTLAISDIAQAYLRIEEVNGKLCCGVASFDMHFLMLKTKEDALLKLEASDRETVETMLQALKEKNPEIKIGYDKPDSPAPKGKK